MDLTRKTTTGVGLALVSLLTLSACGVQPLKSGASANSAVNSLSDSGIEDPGSSFAALLRERLQAPASNLDETPVSDDLWERIRASFRLDHEVNRPRVAAELDMYTRHPNYLARVGARAEPYLHYIVESIEQRGAPLELALLPVVESAFQPNAYSPGRAAGLWQFIPDTGRRFGLEQNWWYDGRRDVYASTQAALDYLELLRDQFDGDWLLALAAYNSGSGTVSRAIEKNRNAGRPTDFWSLDLPRETRSYVPRLLAISAIVSDPGAYGVDLVPITNEPYLARVDLDGQIDLGLAADLAGISLDDLYRYNPGFNRWATAPQGPHYLMLPVEKLDLFNEKLAQVPADERMRWNRYRVSRGDTLGTIAQAHGTSVAMLMDSNKLKSTRIRVGQELLIPVGSGAGVRVAAAGAGGTGTAASAPKGGRKVVHTVQAGDTLWDIARQHGVTTRQIADWNRIALNDTLRRGQKLTLWPGNAQAAAPAAPASTTQSIRYTVRSGDSLWAISKRFRVSVADLRDWNDLATGQQLRPGQRLQVYLNVAELSGNI
ncbi:LysM peptidoglycan-binding domain-containing protein [Thioalbus denitrificans]|uniref:Membrane-bound lytic murein transglycosylase D n=1 Tax=Thioalbus denitrificans TaxID=547122 RepID=A0A369CFG7_9GAMM|nr:LysM peptidoglycan-binding domain-containing protein [Thioalbus denitrificans]RCX30574.1 membrane-bound lytic murein transglycosylase D [Thioalbus denitrificans]